MRKHKSTVHRAAAQLTHPAISGLPLGAKVKLLAGVLKPLGDVQSPPQAILAFLTDVREEINLPYPPEFDRFRTLVWWRAQQALPEGAPSRQRISEVSPSLGCLANRMGATAGWTSLVTE